MKAMILAAGEGKRMRPLTEDCPKPLLHFGQHRLIEYQIKALVKAGFKDIVINTAYLAEQFPKILGDGLRYGAHIQYTKEAVGGYESGGGIINALPLLGHQPFLVTSGDIKTDFPYHTLHNITLSPHHLAHLILVNNPSHHPKGDFCLPDPRSDKPAAEHITLPSSDQDHTLTFGNIGLYHPDFFKGYGEGYLPLREPLHKAIKAGKVTGEHFKGQWINMTHPEQLESLQKC